MRNIKTHQAIEILKAHYRSTKNVLDAIKALLLKYGITPDNTDFDTSDELDWHKELLTLLKTMPGLHTKAQITSALKDKLNDLNISSQTLKTRVAGELMSNDNIVKQKVGNINKYGLKIND